MYDCLKMLSIWIKSFFLKAISDAFSFQLFVKLEVVGSAKEKEPRGWSSNTWTEPSGSSLRAPLTGGEGAVESFGVTGDGGLHAPLLSWFLLLSHENSQCSVILFHRLAERDNQSRWLNYVEVFIRFSSPREAEWEKPTKGLCDSREKFPEIQKGT